MARRKCKTGSEGFVAMRRSYAETSEQNPRSLGDGDGNNIDDQLAGGMEQIHGVSDGNINISDVIEVIQTTDPEFVECNGDERDRVNMFSGGSVEAVGAGSVGTGNSRRSAYVKILEQPASKALRFRYECEGRSAGSIPGVNSTPENKTFPSIRIEGYKGRAVVVVSCVTKDPPYRPHPHNLVGKEACKRGVCTVEIASESMTVTFANLGIQCVKKKDIEQALKDREEIRVDPYRTGFSHRAQPTNIDLNAVRLCFQVFLEGAEKGKFTVPLAPVVSDPIYDKKAMSDLVICKLSDCCCTVAGGKEMILLCEKVAKEDIQVRFFEERDGQAVWEGFADFQPTHVHKQVAISFRAPRYKVLEVDQPVKVFIQLRRPSDGATSEALPFEFLPLDSDPKSKRKRKYANDPSAHMLRHLQAEPDKHGAISAMQYQQLGYNLNPIKSEPAERGPSPYQVAPGAGISTGGLALYHVDRGTTPSPQPPITLQPYRQQMSPGRTPSPMEYNLPPGITEYNILPAQFHHQQLQQQQQQQHQQQQQQQHQQQQQYNVLSQFQSTQQHSYSLQQQIMLNRVTTEQTGSAFLSLGGHGIQNPIVGNIEGGAGGVGGGTGAVSNMLPLDNRQCNFELGSLNQLDSTDLANFSMFDEHLSENLSSNLSLSDIRVTQADSGGRATASSNVESSVVGASNDNGGNGNNMSDSLTRITTSTIQELCTLNSLYNPTRDNTG